MKVVIHAPEYDVHDFVLKEGATEPPLEATLVYDDDETVDLTGATVEFRMKEAGADTRQVDAEATIVTPSDGEIEYQWSGSDTDTVGHYKAEFAVDFSGNTGSNFDPDAHFPNDDYKNIRVLSEI